MKFVAGENGKTPRKTYRHYDSTTNPRGVRKRELRTPAVKVGCSNRMATEQAFEFPLL